MLVRPELALFGKTCDLVERLSIRDVPPCVVAVVETAVPDTLLDCQRHHVAQDPGIPGYPPVAALVVFG